MTNEFHGRSIAQQQLGVFSLSLTDYENGTKLGWHRHAAPYLTYVLRGGYRERLGNLERQCDAHRLVVHDAGEVHADDFAASSRCLNIELDSQFLAQREITLRSTGVVRSRMISSLASRAVSEIRRADSMSPLVLEGLMLEMIGELAREQRCESAPRWLSRVHEVIEWKFREPLTVAGLADVAGVHAVHLSRSFRRQFGRSIGEAIRERRIDFAKSRIRAGADLAEVAMESGFADQSHLTRTFRNFTGLTPSEYRRQHRVPGS